jgi:hypothetical protein
MPKTRKTLKGNLNKLIDELVHPYFQEHPTAIILDGALHAIIEQDPEQSIRKFIKYNSYQLLKHLKKKKTSQPTHTNEPKSTYT